MKLLQFSSKCLLHAKCRQMYVLARFGFFLNCGHPNFGMNHVKTQYNSYIFTFSSEFCSNIQIKLNNNMILSYIKRIIQDCSIFTYTYMLLPCAQLFLGLQEITQSIMFPKYSCKISTYLTYKKPKNSPVLKIYSIQIANLYCKKRQSTPVGNTVDKAASVTCFWLVWLFYKLADVFKLSNPRISNYCTF